jgi:hypothetical protein
VHIAFIVEQLSAVITISLGEIEINRRRRSREMVKEEIF